ncbi:MAG: glycosyltransferase family 4 protein [Candidatus Cyclobacteriaceae bacterium M2_1C_046]
MIFLIKHMWSAQLCLCMFAGYHSILPAVLFKLLKKPFVIILGGTESVSIPSLGYGILHKPIIGRFAKWSYKLTTHFAPVHGSLIASQNTYSDEVPDSQGIQNHLPSLKIDYTEIPNGYDPEIFRKKEDVKKEDNSFLTVAFDLQDPKLFRLKGIDLIISMVNKFPDYKFTIVGLADLPNKPDNLTLLPAVDQEELIGLYSRHQFYFQLSLSEGFPNALCEAMLCECIPMVSNVAAMPKIVDNTGFILMKKDPAYLDYLIRKALDSDKNVLAKKARERIKSSFTEHRRKEMLEMLIKSLT